MPIRKQQIIALEAGDVVFINVQPFGVCCLAVLERELSKLVLSVAADRVEELVPVRTPQWGYLTIDECGNILDQDGDNLTNEFSHGEILIGKAVDVADKYRRRIMPDLRLLRNGKACVSVENGRGDDVRRMMLKIQNMVFNNDYSNDNALLFEMYTRLVKGAPVNELPIYLSALLGTLTMFSRVQEITSTLEEAFSADEISVGKEAEDVMGRMMGKKET